MITSYFFEGPARDSIEYPCLLKAYYDPATIVVLFNEYGVGTIINTTVASEFKLGDYRNDWDMDNFSPIVGKVVLET